MSKRFGGLLALTECSFMVVREQIFGVIGPNGSGKSTLFNVICGLLRPETGDVKLEGLSILGTHPYKLARQGVGRTFQVPRVFEDLTLEENVNVTVTLFGDQANSRASEHLEQFGLSDLRKVLAKDVSHGQQKLLEFAMVSAARPKLLLLDEPTAGVNPRFIARIEEIIRGFREGGATVLMVEHTLRVVDALCDTVIVLDQGRIVASGTPAELKSMPDVRRAYYLL